MEQKADNISKEDPLHDAYSIFVSYSNVDDVSKVLSIVQALEARLRMLSGRQPSFWMDRVALRNDQEFLTQTEAALDRASLFIAFLSPQYFVSALCRREWDYFAEKRLRFESAPSNQHFPIIPLTLKKVDYSKPSSGAEESILRSASLLVGYSFEGLSPSSKEFERTIDEIAADILDRIRFSENGSQADARPSSSEVGSPPKGETAPTPFEAGSGTAAPSSPQPGSPSLTTRPRLADYIAADGWTLVDRLEYDRYIRALYTFVIDARTIAPLCISVQAPWGGGKTSIMRMLQLRLDRKALELDSPDAVKAFDLDAARKAGTSPVATDDSVKQLRSKATQALGELDIGSVLSLLDAWKKAPQPHVDTSLEVAEANAKTCVTIWFNAWKYDGTNQVWAGLVDAIIDQITRRMSLPDRERFFLKLNLSRIDAEKVRTRIYDRVYGLALYTVGPKILYWSVGAIAGLLAGLIGATAHELSLGLGGLAVGAASAIAGFKTAVNGLNSAKKEVSEEKATATLTDLMTMPSYESEIGFLHKADEDLRRVLALVPGDYWPIVVFIDDLDRCSPPKVAQVMEAVNLFLAGEFARCIFIMGMDSEMVAASLDVAHRDVVDALPQEARIPVGWRFMDKFVQLPFVIPPVGNEISELSASLLVTPARQEVIDKATAIISAEAEDADITQSIKAHAPEFGLAEREEATVAVEVRKVRERMAQEREMERFDDNREDVRRAVELGTKYFAGNPREIKRFLNAFRLYVFLWADKTESPESKLSLPIIMRWTVFMMKWPDVLRWIRRAPRLPDTASFDSLDGPDREEGSPTQGNDRRALVANRLKVLEELAVGSPSFNEWATVLQQDMGLPKGTRWLYDVELFQFLRERVEESGGPLSGCLGEGLW